MTTDKGMFRIFNLIRLLNTQPAKTVRQLSLHLDVSRSQIHRDLNMLERLGYIIETDRGYRKFLQFHLPQGDHASLTPDELFFLQEHLQQTASISPQAQSILHKFDRNLSMIPLAETLPLLHQNRLIQLARTAINRQICIRIKGYRSISSDGISDRLVEPLEVTTDFKYLIAWDLEKDRQRQFKFARIQHLEVTEQPIKPGRVATPIDLFGLTGDKWLEVRLQLSNFAYHLLLEEYPTSLGMIRRKTGGIFFEGQVRNWQGIGRFVLGLPGEIEVLSPPAFKKYLQKKVKNLRF